MSNSRVMDKRDTKEFTNIDQKVRYAQVQLLYQQTKTGLIGVLFVALTACVAFWQVVPQWKLSLWAGITILLTLARGFTIFAFQRRAPLTSDIDRWAHLHVLGTILSGLIWAIPAIFLWPVEQSVHQLVWPVCILPLSAAAVATYYTWTPSYTSFLVLTALPISIRFFFEGGFLFNTLGFLSLFFIAVLLRAGMVMHAASVRAFELGIRNKALNMDLKVEITTREQLNARLQQEMAEQKNIEKKLTKSKAAAESANATKDKFFKIISHDLRSPFNSIIGFSNVLNTEYDSFDDLKRKDCIQEINTSSLYAYNLLENLLTWARTQTDGIRINKEKLNLKKLVATSISTYLPNADSKNISVINNVQPELIISIDENTALTFIRNIVSNAIKFTHEGGHIIIDSHVNDDSIMLQITDTGVGMSPEVIDNLFQIDKDISTKGTNNEKGTGLGLILCKEFIERNGGSIIVKSEVNKGSEFIISLPLESD
jgi:signal transduction histidine kinase